jgi:hypothetical protein
MKRPHTPAILAALAASIFATQNPAAFAQGTAPAAPAPAAAAPAAASAEAAKPAIEPYVLKNKSSVSIPAGTRPPYWPIGWRPDSGPAPTQAPKAQVDEDYFKVTSILLGNPTLALINGRSYGEGQFIRMPKGSPMKPRVYRISDGEVIIQVDQQLIHAPLKRGTLNDKPAELEMLNSEKEDTGPVPIKQQ